MPKEDIKSREVVETHVPAPHAVEICAHCHQPLGQQRYRALDQIVCSTKCAKVVHGD